MQECDFAGQVDGDQGGGIKHEEKGYPRNKKSDWPLIMTQAFIWKGNGHLLVYYRLLHECTICTMLEHVKLRLARGEVLHDITAAIGILGILLKNSGSCSGSSRKGSGGGVEVVLYFVVL